MKITNVFLFIICLSQIKDLFYSLESSSFLSHVQVFHYIIHYWGELRSGVEICKDINLEDPGIICEFFNDKNLKILSEIYNQAEESRSPATITVSLYNIHYLHQSLRRNKPDKCLLPTNLTIAESEESRVRYGFLFDNSFKFFDGNSTISPVSSVQRIYSTALLNSSTFINLKPFDKLIRGAAYVASDCHKRDSANSHRDELVSLLRNKAGYRVDGLGRCLHTSHIPENISLGNSHNSELNLIIKREAISNYLFYLAFENSIETGYVTEKVFDGLIAGTVPIYLGATSDCKSLIPHPKSVIFLEDFKNDVWDLAKYLNYLSSNITAYEEHRAWRYQYDEEAHHRRTPLLSTSWTCRICQWAKNFPFYKKAKSDSC